MFLWRAKRLTPPGPRRSAVRTCARNDAVRLLRVINMTQSHGSVGARVVPVEAAREAWLEPGTERYDEALWYLLWQSVVAMPIGRPFGYSSYHLTATAIRMVEEG
jgi:hypothetical protein